MKEGQVAVTIGLTSGLTPSWVIHCMYLQLRTYTYVPIPTYLYLRTYTYVPIPTNLYLRTYTHVPISTNLYPSAYTHVPILTYLYPRTYTYLPSNEMVCPSVGKWRKNAKVVRLTFRRCNIGKNSVKFCHFGKMLSGLGIFRVSKYLAKSPTVGINSVL